jgi:hypothetical protein
MIWWPKLQHCGPEEVDKIEAVEAHLLAKMAVSIVAT